MSMTTKKLMNVSPADYATAAALARAVGEQMLARLEWVALQPSVIVDVGCGVGHFGALLQQRYPTAKIMATDIAYPMLQYAKQQAHQSSWICADASVLPFRDHSVDLVFANLVLPWCADLEKSLREWRRILRPEGLLMFTSLGPDTLRAWRDDLANITIPDFIDMHNIGDVLTRARFADPVMDVEYFTLTYRKLTDLFHELHASGMLNIADDHYEQLVAMGQARCTTEGIWSVNYEVVYGHAWGPSETVEQVADEFGTVRIPLSHLRRRA